MDFIGNRKAIKIYNRTGVLLMKRDFSQVLGEFLRDNRMTQIAFARAIGADKDQVSRWLKGQSAPNYWEIQKMSTVFDISADYFLGLSESY